MGTDISTYVFHAAQRDGKGKWALHKDVIGFHNILFILSGTCDFYFNGKKRRVSAGDVAYYAKGAVRETSNTSPDALIYAFDFNLYGCDRLPLPDITHFDDFEAFMPDFKSFFFQWYQKYDGYMLMCSGIFTMILATLMYPNTQRKVNAHVNAMKAYIAEHLSESVTVNQIAHIVNLCPAYCGALFIKSEGMSLHEFINKMRINRAKDLLVSGSLSISEISETIGYSDMFYFSKKFRLLTGMSPSDYRRLHLQ